MIAASVYVITLNEDHHLKRMLESVKDFAEIIVVDSGSDDDTVKIAKMYTDNIVFNKWETEAKQRKYALSLCTQPWVLTLDADEEVDEVLRQQIKDLIQTEEADALEIKFLEYFMGEKSSLYAKHNTHMRFFRKDKFNYELSSVHVPVTFTGTIKKAKGYIHHFSKKPIALVVSKINNYSTLKANDKFKKGKKASLLKLLLVFPLVFFKSYILKRSFFNGTRGFIISVTNAYYAFLKEAKLYELQMEKH